MKKKIKLLVFIMSTLLIFALLSCSKADDDENNDKDEVTNIVIWNYYNGAQKTAFDEMVSEFNKTIGIEKRISVSSISHGSVNELTTEIINAADKKVGASKLPSMFATYIDTAKEIDEKGLIANLDDYFSKEELKKYVDEYIEEGRFDLAGSLKVFPTAKATEVLMMNKTDWDKFSLDTGAKLDELKTWEGLVSVAEKYYQWSDGKAFCGRDALANYMLIGSMQLGEEIFIVDNEGKVTVNLNKEVMRRLWDNYYIPYINGYFTNEGKYASDDLKTGSIISYVGSTSSASYFPKEVFIDDNTYYEIDCMVFSVPDFEGGKEIVVQQGAGYSVIKSTKKEEEACAVFLKWFTESERNTYFAALSSYLPVTKESNSKDYVEKVVEKRKIELSQVVLETLKVSIDKVSNSKTYTTKAFKNGYGARGVLEKTILEYCKSDRASIEELISGGMDEKSAIGKYDTNENFDKWYNDIFSQINDLLENIK